MAIGGLDVLVTGAVISHYPATGQGKVFLISSRRSASPVSRWRRSSLRAHAGGREGSQSAPYVSHPGRRENLRRALLQHVPTAVNRDSQDTPEVRV
jgi:hypothetical protein